MDPVLKLILENVDLQFWANQTDVENFVNQYGFKVSKPTIARIFDARKIVKRVVEGKGIVYRSKESNDPTLEEYLLSKVDENNWKTHDNVVDYLKKNGIKASKPTVAKIFEAINIKKRVVEGNGIFYRSKESDLLTFKKYLLSKIDENYWKTYDNVVDYLKSNGIKASKPKIAKIFEDTSVEIKVIEGEGLCYRSEKANCPTLEKYLLTIIDQYSWETYSDVQEYLYYKGIDVSQAYLFSIFDATNVKKTFDPKLQKEVYRSAKYHKVRLYEKNADVRQKLLHSEAIQHIDSNYFKTIDEAAESLKRNNILDIAESTLCQKFQQHEIALKVVEGIGLVYRSDVPGTMTLEKYLRYQVDQHDWKIIADAVQSLAKNAIHFSENRLSVYFEATNITKRIIEGKGIFYRSKESGYPRLEEYLISRVKQCMWETAEEVEDDLWSKKINTSSTTILSIFKKFNIEKRIVLWKGLCYRPPTSKTKTLEQYLEQNVDNHIWKKHMDVVHYFEQKGVNVSVSNIRDKLIAINAKKVFDPTVGKKVYRSQKKCLEIEAGQTDTQNFLSDTIGDQVKRTENEIIIRRTPVTPKERLKRHNQALWKKYQKELQEKQQEILELARQSSLPNQKFVYKPYEKETSKDVFFKTADGAVYLKKYTIAPLKINQIPNILQSAKAQGNVIQLVVIPEQSQQVNIRIVGRDGSVRMTGGGSGIEAPRGLLKSGPGSQEGRMMNVMKQLRNLMRSSKNGSVVRGPGFIDAKGKGFVIKGPSPMPNVRLASRAANGYIGLFIVVPAVYKNVKTIATTDKSTERNSAYTDLGVMAGQMWFFTKFIAKKYPKTAAVIMVGIAGKHVWDSTTEFYDSLGQGKTKSTIIFINEQALKEADMSCNDGRRVELLNPIAAKFSITSRDK